MMIPQEFATAPQVPAVLKMQALLTGEVLALPGGERDAFLRGLFIGGGIGAAFKGADLEEIETASRITASMQMVALRATELGMVPPLESSAYATVAIERLRETATDPRILSGYVVMRELLDVHARIQLERQRQEAESAPEAQASAEGWA